MRYAKQMQVNGFGETTQRALAAATVAIIGCGGLGTWQAELLVRMGVGRILIADDDRVTLGNLHRQILFTEQDAQEKVLKVEAALARLTRLNRNVQIEVFRERITRVNIDQFARPANLLLDATDHTPTRFLINDYAVSHQVPWVYAGVAGQTGLILPVVPLRGPCLRCLYPVMPQPEEVVDCQVEGILPMTVASVASCQIAQAVRILNGSCDGGILIRLNAWEPQMRLVRVSQSPECSCCVKRCFESLTV